MVAKKSSSNAIKKIDKQLDNLEKKNKDKVEEVAEISKKELQEKVKEATTPKKTTSTKKKTTTTKKTTPKKEAIVVEERPEVTEIPTPVVIVVERPEEKEPEEAITEIEVEEPKEVVEEPEEKKEEKEEEPGESTKKLTQLEDEMRSLYDRVNDVVDDITFIKEVNEIQDVLISDVVESKEKTDDKLEDISNRLLYNLTIALAIIFFLLLIFVIGIIVFVCTY